MCLTLLVLATLAVAFGAPLGKDLCTNHKDLEVVFLSNMGGRHVANCSHTVWYYKENHTIVSTSVEEYPPST